VDAGPDQQSGVATFAEPLRRGAIVSMGHTMTLVSATGWVRAQWRHLPRGGALPQLVLERRHRGIRAVLWLHVPALFVFALVAEQGDVIHAAAEAAVIALFPVGALVSRRHPTLSITMTSLGLMTSSAELVHLTDGLIEMHFHFFVMVGVITLYQAWTPFLVAIGYVVIQHGVAGVIDPTSVYNHPAAVDNPWGFALIHGVFILAMSSVGIVSWKLNEALVSSATDSLSLLNATLESTADGILVVDTTGRIVSYNTRFANMWRIPQDILDSRDDEAAISSVLEQLEQPGRFVAKVNELYSTPGAESMDMLMFNDGRVFERFSRPQILKGDIVGRVWSFRDITDRHRLEAELEHQAFHDSLTELANRALFRDRVDHALTRMARSSERRLAVLFLDLDNFKTVNDSLGHTAGDELLVAVGHRIRQCLRPEDTAARVGGDEFAVLLEDLDSAHHAIEVSERVLEALHRPIEVADKEIVVSASIGISMGAVDMQVEQVLGNADLAMYTAKREGRNRYKLYVAEMHEAAIERMEVESALRRACSRQELVVHYQPIVSLQTGAVDSVEALVRWRDPDRGLISPAAFIPFAEDSDLIEEIGRDVLRQACQQAVQWSGERADMTNIGVAVNISPRHVRDPRFVSNVNDALTVSGLQPHRLTIEITESAVMHDSDIAYGHLVDLKSLGVRLALDDFGTGYSSLSHLQRFPIDVLKIDRSFVERLDRGRDQAALAQAIIRLAVSLSLVAVAEGIETESQLTELVAAGCQRGQGYLFSPAVPPSAIPVVIDALSARWSETMAPITTPRQVRS